MKTPRTTAVLPQFLLALLVVAARCHPDRPAIPRLQSAEFAPAAKTLVGAKTDAIAAGAFVLLTSRSGKAIADAGVTSATDLRSSGASISTALIFQRPRGGLL